MAFHAISIIPVRLMPSPVPRTHAKHELLQGLWLGNINGEIARVSQKRPLDSTITAMHDAFVMDYPAYVGGLLKRLEDEGLDSGLSTEELSSRNEDRAYLDHPLEIFVQEEDIIKLVMMSCILAGILTLSTPMTWGDSSARVPFLRHAQLL